MRLKKLRAQEGPPELFFYKAFDRNYSIGFILWVFRVDLVNKSDRIVEVQVVTILRVSGLLSHYVL